MKRNSPQSLIPASCKFVILLATILMPMNAFATDEAAAPAKPKMFELAGSLALTTNYLFRGQTQTFGGPAIQGSLEARQYADHGFLVGLWASNVSSVSYPNGSGLELDAYFGYNYKHDDDLSMKILAYGYFYPGSKPTPVPLPALPAPQLQLKDDTYDAMEIIPSVSYKWLTVTYACSVTDKSGVNENFADLGWGKPLKRNGSSRGSWYLEGALRIPLFRDDLALNLVYGYQNVNHYSKLNYSNYGASIDYTTPEEWHSLNFKVGVSATNNDKNYYTFANAAGNKKDVGRTVAYFILSKSF